MRLRIAKNPQREGLLYFPIASLSADKETHKMTKFKVNITFLAHCNACNKDVSVLPLLNRGDLVMALQNEVDVRVMHVATEQDHIWSLNSQDKDNLSNAMARGLV